MGSISVGELKQYLSHFDDDTEVVMYIKHKYDISKESGKKGWIALINGIAYEEGCKELRLMN